MLTLPGELAALVLAALLGVFVGWLFWGRGLPMRRARRGPKHAARRRSAFPTPYTGDLSTGDVRVLPRNGRNGRRREPAGVNGSRIDPPSQPDTEPAPPGPSGQTEPAVEPAEPAAAAAERDGAERDGTERDGAERGGAEWDGAEWDGAEWDGADRDGTERGGAESDGAERRDTDSGDAAGRRAGTAKLADGAAVTGAAEAAVPADSAAVTGAAEPAVPEHPAQAAEDLAAEEPPQVAGSGSGSGSAEAAAGVGPASASQIEPHGSARSGAAAPAGDIEPAAPPNSGVEPAEEAAVARTADGVAEGDRAAVTGSAEGAVESAGIRGPAGSETAAGNGVAPAGEPVRRSDDLRRGARIGPGPDAASAAADPPESAQAVAERANGAVRPIQDAAGMRVPAGSGAVAGNGAAPAGEPVQGSDDLRQVVGIGPVIHRVLAGAGITTYRQLALLGDDDGEALALATAALGADVRGRIERQRWVEQARELHFRKYGERL